MTARNWKKQQRKQNEKKIFRFWGYICISLRWKIAALIWPNATLTVLENNSMYLRKTKVCLDSTVVQIGIKINRFIKNNIAMRWSSMSLTIRSNKRKIHFNYIWIDVICFSVYSNANGLSACTMPTNESFRRSLTEYLILVLSLMRTILALSSAHFHRLAFAFHFRYYFFLFVAFLRLIDAILSAYTVRHK